MLRHIRLGERWPLLALLALALLGGSGILERALETSPFQRVEATAMAYLDASKASAVEAFAAGRVLNGAISFLKSVEVTPFGVGAAPLQALEPVDDLAKQFSDVMLVSVAAILLQELLLSIGRSVGLDLLLPAGCLIWLLADLLPGFRFGARLGRLARGIVILALFVRLVIPLAGWIDAGFTDRFLAADRDRAVSSMKLAGDSLTRHADAAGLPGASASSGGDPGAPETARPAANAATGWQALAARLDALESAIGRMTSSAHAALPDLAAISHDLADLPNEIVRGIEIFVVQTMLAPALLALLFFVALRSLVPTPQALELEELRRLALRLVERLEDRARR